MPTSADLNGNRVPASRYIAFIVIALVGAAADLLSKQWVFAWMDLPGTRPDNIYPPDGSFIFIQTSVNQGALFGLGQGWGWLFVGLSVIAAICIPLWLFYGRVARDWLLTISLGLVMGGIFGNLYDRLGLWHDDQIPAHFRNGVRDWILIRIGKFEWPNFNIADSLLVCGAILLAWHAFTYREPAVSHSQDTPASQ